ncbi:50S ribosomal protein L5 [Candidatus Wolfebacteria bacterium]|nr:50S ribosomal protein L5 [Candidatus Wolfebacteria bacterium]
MDKTIIKNIKEKLGYKNDLEVPKIKKIVLNIGAGRLSQQSGFEDRILPEIIKDFSLISGQKPSICKAKKSIAGFKIREGQIIGLKITLRKKRMDDFFKKLINVVIPRLRDFKGLDLRSVDSGGNLTIGFKDQMVFPEINPETSKVDFGLEISIVSNIKNKEKAIEFYRILGVPLKKN